jgi:hypothetical protein
LHQLFNLTDEDTEHGTGEYNEYVAVDDSMIGRKAYTM